MKIKELLKFVLVFFTFIMQSTEHAENEHTLVFMAATSETDGFLRYLHSAKEYGIKPLVLGWGDQWKEGNIRKVALVREAILPYKDDKNRIILFTDGYDVIFVSNLVSILEKFKETGARVLFAAEGNCWPDESLEVKYPLVEEGKRFLNSGIYIGYAPELFELLNYPNVVDTVSDQLFFTKAYLNKELRTALHFQLDHTSQLFQCLYQARNDVELISEANEITLRNIVTNSKPLIIHGNGKPKHPFNAISNYLGRAWLSDVGCQYCKWDQVDFKEQPVIKMPVVLLALFVERPTPFIEEMLEKVAALNYPKERMHLFLHNMIEYHSSHIHQYLDQYGQSYLSVKQIVPDDNIANVKARDDSLDYCVSQNCDFYFTVDSLSHLDNPEVLRVLLEQNRTVIAPLLVRPKQAWSNFWGDLTSDGFYTRSHDYMDIVENNKRGLWIMPFINNCYLINAKVLLKYDRIRFSYTRGNLDTDMAFCANLRELDVFMYVSNRVDFGHLIDPDAFDTTLVAPDLYQILSNELDWERRYIHSEYQQNFDVKRESIQACTDVSLIPIVTKRFSNDLIAITNTNRKWSDPTTQITVSKYKTSMWSMYMNDLQWESHWIQFLKKWVKPIQELLYVGYEDDPDSGSNLVVRQEHGKHQFLEPHNDNSTYTIQIFLNEVGVDYEGGGYRFLRYNCNITDLKPGWMIMYPGRFTHYHEDILVTNGVKYTAVAYINP